jgi:hypothetical protein
LGRLDQANFQYHWSHPDPRMDRLHQTVTAAVEDGLRAGDEASVIFDRLRALAHAMAGRQAPPAVANRSRQEPRPPRLTESWFCCAEPTDSQLRPLHTKGLGEI